MSWEQKAKTKTAAVALAVDAFNQRYRMAALTRHFGTFKDFMTQADLKRMREDDNVLDETAYLLRSPKNDRRTLAPVRGREGGQPSPNFRG